MNIKVIISWLLVIIWMIVIFNFSNMNSDDSNNVSKGTIDKVITNTAEVTNKVGITDINLNKIEKNKMIDKLNLPVRKMAHCFCYFVLFILVYVAFRCSNIKFRNYMIVILLFCFMYSLIDEYHQTFVSGRTGQFMDCLIDTFGSFIAFCIINFYLVVKKYKDKRNLTLT